MQSAATQWSTLAAFDALVNGAASRIEAAVHTGYPGSVVFRFILHGKISGIRLPVAEQPGRADHLWKHTCFEAFVKKAGSTAYHELNFAPSGDWAAYRFDDYREGMSSPRFEPPPEIAIRRTERRLEVDARVNIQNLIPGPLSGSLQIGLSAVIEDEDNRLSYWALRHPADKPDFHSAAAFALHFSV